MLTFCCLKLIRVHYHNKELLFIVKILPPCVFCKITSKVFMLGHRKKTTNIAKALWLAMAIKTSLWLQILISEKNIWHIVFATLTFSMENEFVKTTMTILTCLGGLRWPVTCFYRQLSIGFTFYAHHSHHSHTKFVLDILRTEASKSVDRNPEAKKYITFVLNIWRQTVLLILAKKSKKLLFIRVPLCAVATSSLL